MSLCASPGAGGQIDRRTMDAARHLITHKMASMMRCVNNIRVLSADIVEKAKSGHPGAPMGCAPIAHVLYSKVMKYDPKAPKWMGRDRFVLSNGHASALLYSMLHLTGYDLPMAELQVGF